MKDYIFSLSKAGRDTFELLYCTYYGNDIADVKCEVIDRYYNYDTQGTYRKKMFAIMHLHNNIDSRRYFSDEKKANAVENVMAAYLFIKLLRNKMAHANDGTANKDDVFALNKLNELYKFDINGSTKKIKSALIKSVEYVKGAEKSVKFANGVEEEIVKSVQKEGNCVNPVQKAEKIAESACEPEKSVKPAKEAEKNTEQSGKMSKFQEGLLLSIKRMLRTK